MRLAIGSLFALIVIICISLYGHSVFNHYDANQTMTTTPTPAPPSFAKSNALTKSKPKVANNSPKKTMTQPKKVAPKMEKMRYVSKARNKEPLAKVTKKFTAPNLSVPQKWIDELSGSRAGIKMGIQANRNECKGYNCDHQRRDQDVGIIGIVTNTEAVNTKPTTPLKGNIKTGRYEDYTPAVYVE